MATFLTYLASLCLFAKAIIASALVPSSCYPQSIPLLYHLRLQCPLSLSPSLPIQVNGDTLERILASSRGDNVYYSVLFYSSWCPFSQEMLSKYDSLSFMFPQITHLAVEKSSAMPSSENMEWLYCSVFSRYRVYRVPTIMIINGASRVQYDGPKTLPSIAHFYQRTTGFEGMQKREGEEEKGLEFLWKEEGLYGWGDRYLMYGILFLAMRVVVYLLPRVVEKWAQIWEGCGIGVRLGEVGLVVRHIGNVVDGRRVWNRIKLCKKRNLQQGARCAGVWASSSLASVSLGEASRL